MALRGSPAPHWIERNPAAAAVVSRLAPVLDPASGVWGFQPGGTPNGAFVLDSPTGIIGIDASTTIGLKPTLLPSGIVAIY